MYGRRIWKQRYRFQEAPISSLFHSIGRIGLAVLLHTVLWVFMSYSTCLGSIPAPGVSVPSLVIKGGQAFAAGGGTGAINITAPQNYSWTVSGAPDWVTFSGATNRSGNGSINYQVMPSAGVARSATITVAGLTFTIEQQAATISGLNFVGSMPHIAAQDVWTTTFTLVNKATTAATARMSLFGDPSDLLTLPLTFPQQPPAPGPLLASSYDRFLHPGLLDLWTVTGSLALAGAKGNAETSTLTTPFTFVRASNTTRTTAYFNSIRSSATIGGASTQTIRGGWGYNRNLTKRIFANAFNDYEYDKFQSLDLRVVLGGGIGYEVWTGKNGRLGAVAGGAWNREKFSPASSAAFTRNSAEAYWGDDFNYKLNTRTNLVQSFRMFNNLSNSGQYRMNFDAGATTQIAKWLNWTVSLSDRYLSNPAPGRNSNDILYATGLGFTFAR